ncbi:MAG: hypothetical protein IJM19_05925, partial [Ruminococcus sp.]|nr:hypothetical protein [Ruminococcus sp.]
MKKFLVAILFSVFVISLSSCAFAEYYNEGHAGSEADPYAIDSNADMVLLRDRVNAGTEEGGKYYKLTQNLTMSEYTNWDTIGIEKYPFKGHFDGNNLGIQVNMTANRDMSGIFGVISTTEGYAVKNLAVSGHVGGLISGGIIARLNSGNVENCSFNGTVENTYGSPARNGGIVGYLAGGTVKNCSFSGNVNEIHSYNNLAAGGIAGYMTGGSIENCTSNANIQVDSGRDNIWAGGIVGYAQVAGFQAIKDCTFSGTINSKRYSGGIVGYISGGNLQNNHVTSVSNSFSSINGDYVAGGIAGRIGDNVILESCDVVAGTSITAKTEASGGIIGLVNNDSTVRNNISYANVSGDTANKGGVIGKVVAATSTFSNNRYSSAAHGIGLDDNGVSSERG